MAKNDSRSSSSRSSSSRSSSSNGRMGGIMDTAREHPVAAAAAAGAAVAAGAFLWSKRGQISDQMSQMTSSDESTKSSSTRSGAFASDSSPAIRSQTGSTRATGGQSATGQNMNPSRSSTPSVSY